MHFDSLRYGIAGKTNVQGEEVKKLDVLSNELFINMLTSSFTTCSWARRTSTLSRWRRRSAASTSCASTRSTARPTSTASSRWALSLEFTRNPGIPQCRRRTALQPGRNLVAAGYALYGSATMIVLSIGRGVNGFMYDPAIGEFILTERNMRMPDRGNIYR